MELTTSPNVIWADITRFDLSECVHRQRFESQTHATRAIGDWIRFYNNRRTHQALAMRTPAEAFRLAA